MHHRPGRVLRMDSGATRTPMFHQIAVLAAAAKDKT